MEYHPTSSQVAKVTEIFADLLTDYPDGQVDMADHWVTRTYERVNPRICACHGGWVAFWDALDDAQQYEGPDVVWKAQNPSDWRYPVRPNPEIVTEIASVGASEIQSEDGEDLIADILFGASDRALVKRYYGAHAWTWGSPNGEEMFDDARAFGDNDEPTLVTLFEHWNGVMKRTRRIEEEMRRSGRDFDEVEADFGLESA